MHPWDFIGDPALIAGREGGGIVERAGVDFGELRQRGVGEKKRAAAIGTEGTDALGKTDFAGCSFGPAQRILRKKSPRNGRCATCLPAVFAMTKAGLHGRSVHFVADRTAEAAALVCGQFRHGEYLLDPTNVRQEAVVPR